MFVTMVLCLSRWFYVCGGSYMLVVMVLCLSRWFYLFVSDSADTPGRVVCREQIGGCLHLEWEPPLVDAETSLLYTLQVREQGTSWLLWQHKL